MAFIKVPSHIKTSILAFVKHLVSKSVYNDIKSLLEPCCKPTLRIYNNYTCTGDSYTIFNAVSVVSEQNKNKIEEAVRGWDARRAKTTRTNEIITRKMREKRWREAETDDGL